MPHSAFQKNIDIKESIQTVCPFAVSFAKGLEISEKQGTNFQ